MSPPYIPKEKMRKNIDDTGSGKAEHKNREQKLWPMTMGDMRKYLKTTQIWASPIKSPTAFILFSCTISALSKVEKSHPNAFENLGAIKREETPPHFPPLHFTFYTFTHFNFLTNENNGNGSMECNCKNYLLIFVVSVPGKSDPIHFSGPGK